MLKCGGISNIHYTITAEYEIGNWSTFAKVMGKNRMSLIFDSLSRYICWGTVSESRGKGNDVPSLFGSLSG